MMIITFLHPRNDGDEEILVETSIPQRQSIFLFHQQIQPAPSTLQRSYHHSNMKAFPVEVQREQISDATSADAIELQFNNDSSSSISFDALQIQDLPIMIDNSSLSSFSSLTSCTVQSDLRWGCDRKLAQRYCNDDRYDSGGRSSGATNTIFLCQYLTLGRPTTVTDKIVPFSNAEEEEDDFCFEIQSTFEEEAPEELKRKKQVKFYDSNSGKTLFLVPAIGVHRTFEEFMQESLDEGFLSFRDYETNWERVRCLPSRELVSVDGTKLGFHSPDEKGNKYLVNILAVCGRPVKKKRPQSRRHSLTMAIANPQRTVTNLTKTPRKAIQRILASLEVETFPAKDEK
jgi:hypothetical protein